MEDSSPSHPASPSSYSPPPPGPAGSSRHKIGWVCMLTGFALIILAGAAFYLSPQHANGALYATLGNYLMASGFVIYVVGRIVRGRPRRSGSGY